MAGIYSVEVGSLAQSQKLIANGLADSSAAMGGDTTTALTFDFGKISGGAFTAYDADADTGETYAGATFTDNGEDSYNITINSDNNSLEGIRDAINAAKMGVTATIADEGLNASLDKKVGGNLAENLASLYAYMSVRLTQVNLNNDMGALDEVARLLNDLKGARESIRPGAAAGAPAATTPAKMADAPPPLPPQQQRMANKLQSLYGRM